VGKRTRPSPRQRPGPSRIRGRASRASGAGAAVLVGAVIAVLLVVLTAFAPLPVPGGPGGSAGLRPAGGTPKYPTPIRHVVVIWFENHELGQILRWNLPFEHSLAAKYALSGQSYSVRHDSEPDYLAAAGGIDANGFKVGGYTTPSLAAPIGAMGESWTAYFGGMPNPCYAAYDWPTGYEVSHDPWVQFSDVHSNRTYCNAHVLPFWGKWAAAWNASVASGKIPNFTWIDPDIFHDQHSGSPSVGDAWLKSVVSPLQNSSAWNSTAVIVTYDEGLGPAIEGYNASLQTPLINTTGGLGGNVYTVIASPQVRGGYNSSRPYQTYSVLTTVEWLLGLCPGGGCVGLHDQWSLYPPMKDLFTAEPKWTPSGYRVSGTVTNTSTGRGIYGAHVVITSAHYANGVDTDVNGSYSMPVPNGTYSVYVTALGYEMAKAIPTVTVSGQPVAKLDFALGPAPATWFPISGKVTDKSTGTALAGIQILVTSGVTTKETWTASDGVYALDVPNGTYKVTAIGYPSYANSSRNVTVSGAAVTKVSFALSPSGTGSGGSAPASGQDPTAPPGKSPVSGGPASNLGPSVLTAAKVIGALAVFVGVAALVVVVRRQIRRAERRR
jgi:hypothetical protein